VSTAARPTPLFATLATFRGQIARLLLPIDAERARLFSGLPRLPLELRKDNPLSGHLSFIERTNRVPLSREVLHPQALYQAEPAVSATLRRTERGFLLLATMQDGTIWRVEFNPFRADRAWILLYWAEDDQVRWRFRRLTQAALYSALFVAEGGLKLKEAPADHTPRRILHLLRIEDLSPFFEYGDRHVWERTF